MNVACALGETGENALCLQHRERAAAGQVDLPPPTDRRPRRRRSRPVGRRRRSSDRFRCASVMVGGVRSDTGSTTFAGRADVAGADRSRSRRSTRSRSDFAVDGMVIVNEVIADGCAGSTVRVCVSCATPVTFSVIDATPPESCTDDGDGGLLSRVHLRAGRRAGDRHHRRDRVEHEDDRPAAPPPSDPFVSDAEACTRSIEPGAASAGTWNENDSVRSERRRRGPGAGVERVAGLCLVADLHHAEIVRRVDRDDDEVVVVRGQLVRRRRRPTATPPAARRRSP